MFALPGLIALVLVDSLRPQEYLPALKGLPLLHLAALVSGAGLVLDIRAGLSRLRPAPHLGFVLFLYAWALITLAVRAPEEVADRVSGVLVPLLMYLLVAHAVQSFRMLQVLCGALLAVALLLGVFGIYQALAPWGCHRIAVADGSIRFVHDGRPCLPEEAYRCEAESGEPGVEYACERVGLMGTSSIRGRIRYRGTLEDPNELALVIAVALPFAFAFVDRRRSVARIALAGASVVVIGLCTYFTQSRGGQLVFLTVLAVYLVHRVGISRGVLAGGLLALPVLLLGGRSGASADASSMQRLEAWSVGLRLTTSSPILGVGFNQFVEHHPLTAHSAYVLAAAELGLPGLIAWSAILYLSLKIAVRVMRTEAAPVARTWALAMFSATAGMLVGIAFLSFAYKTALWTYVGLTGVLYQAVRRHDPGFRVEFGLRDLGIVVAADAGILLALTAYTGMKLGWGP
jgi:hypothetical protein